MEGLKGVEEKRARSLSVLTFLVNDELHFAADKHVVNSSDTVLWQRHAAMTVGNSDMAMKKFF